MNKDITTKELLEKLARTVAPLGDAQLDAVAGGFGKHIVFTVDEVDIITVTNSTSGGRQDDCMD
jgi:hypothetical protein